ncbi:MAG: PLP-dependent aminotransferase family protein [Acidocella sp.]|nr:PLP-dependent aminotransferase family protein [Acidocella sp.]
MMLRPWELRIVLDRSLTVPAYLQITHAIIDAIRQGRLAPGSALPGARDLASLVGVNRKTVQQSYEELIAQGWATAEEKRGTFVSALLPLLENEGPVSGLPTGAARFLLRRQPPDLPFQLTQPGTLSFDDGAPDTRLMPAALVARAYRRALLDSSRRNRLGYGDPRGSAPLRQAVADMLNADRGLNCNADNICITRGSQMGIFLAARLLAQPGDVVAIESLSYPPAREAFRAAGATIAAVGLDDQGMKIDELEACCRKHPVRAVYVTPHHQFPTTVVMPPNRRIRLLALAEQFNFAIVEDDYDHEFHFAHRLLLPLASVHGWGKLFYIGSLSKLLSPSLRIGYIAAAKEVINRAAAEIMMIDRQGDPVTEAAAADIMVSGALKSHTRKVLRIYGQRRECLAEALHRSFGDLVKVTLPLGGLALWVNFAPQVNFPALEGALRVTKVMLTRGQIFATNGYQTNGARLGFGSMNETELQDAVSRLWKAYQSSF